MNLMNIELTYNRFVENKVALKYANCDANCFGHFEGVGSEA